MEFKGRIVKLGAITGGTSNNGKNWSALEFIVEEEGQYPNKAKFKYFATDDKTKYVKSFLDKARIGSLVDINFNIKCTEYQGKFYNELNVFNVKFLDADVSQERQDFAPPLNDQKDDGLGLPF